MTFMQLTHYSTKERDTVREQYKVRERERENNNNEHPEMYTWEILIVVRHNKLQEKIKSNID